MKSQSGVYWNNAEARKNTLNRTAKSDGMKFIIYTNKFATTLTVTKASSSPRIQACDTRHRGD